MHPRLVVLPFVVVAAAFAIWKWSNIPEAVPACTWRTGTGTEVHQGTNFDKLAPDSPLRLSVHCQTPAHLYVWSHSAEDGTVLMFPSTEVQSDLTNPLPAGQSVLPGKFDGKELAWTSRSGILATTTYVAFASNEKIPELEELLPKVRVWTNRVLGDRSMQVRNPTAEGEPVGKPRTEWPIPLLQLAAAHLREQTDPNGPMLPLPGHPGVWVASWKILEKR